MTRTPLLAVAFSLAVLVVLAAAPRALAQGREDIKTLEKNLADETAALSTSDCTAACRALASIRRAADKICALEPGDRCTAAHAKAEDATRRVRDACPDCAIASAPTPSPNKPVDQPAMQPAPSKKGAPPPAEPSPGAVPAAESQGHRGGCAGCTTAEGSPGDLAVGVLGLMGMIALLRRRRSER